VGGERRVGELMNSGTRRLKDINSAETMFLLTLGVRVGPPVMLILLGAEYLHWGTRFIWFVLPDIAITVLVVIAAQWALDKFSWAAGSILLPTGRSTPAPREYSEQESLIIRGQFAEAADSFRDIVADNPQNIDARMRLGALLERECNDTAAAEQCYRVVRRLTPTPEQDWAASNALIELHQRTGEAGKLRIELQRIARQYRALPIGGEATRRLELLPGTETPASPALSND
jgi:tetratricopeptide repeat protein